MGMDTLYLKAAGPDLYVTHEDDLKCLETVSEIRTPLTISVRSATKFLQRIMEHERNVKNEPTIEVEVEEPDPEDPTKSKLALQTVPLLHNFLTILGASANLFRNGTFFRLYEAARTKGIEFWKKAPSKAGSTSNSWNDLSAFVELHLSRVPQEVKDQWKFIVSLHDRVAMVSVENKQFMFGEKAVSSMLAGQYTHRSSYCMYQFVLHHVPSTRHLNYLDPEEFFAILDVQNTLDTRQIERNGSKSEKQWAQKYGFILEEKRFGMAAQQSQRLTFKTSLIGMYPAACRLRK